MYNGLVFNVGLKVIYIQISYVPHNVITILWKIHKNAFVKKGDK